MVKPLDDEHRYLQGTMDHKARTCPYIWNLKCVHYECGKRQVKFRAQTRIVGGNRLLHNLVACSFIYFRISDRVWESGPGSSASKSMERTTVVVL